MCEARIHASLPEGAAQLEKTAQFLEAYHQTIMLVETNESEVGRDVGVTKNYLLSVAKNAEHPAFR